MHPSLLRLPPWRFLLPLVVLLPACAAFKPGYETPTVTVSSFRALPSAGALPNFEIGLEVVNPNRDPLDLVGVSYTVSLDGHDIIKGVANDLPVIEGYGTGHVTLNASANLLAGVQLFSELLRGPKESFDYRLRAKLDPGGFLPAIRVEESGTLSAGTFERRVP